MLIKVLIASYPLFAFIHDKPKNFKFYSNAKRLNELN